MSLACGGDGKGTVKHCYKIVDSGETSLFVIEDGSPSPSVTIMAEDGSNPQKTFGRLEPGAFVYANGSKMMFDKKKLSGAKGSFLEGIEGKATSCP